ncbi:patatin-like phospholipase family protein [Methylocystis sp. H4A]|uniref:patatin-like phospholipase family protein n=1 Tax=Methylocystis sp. H4A TaxID=2785788 RepID=UPI0018C23D57|nr:patatin-like phospholipase family protein [Methylocystis sp. H4A]MBG0802206.1 patatin-like phospholipase family protein [Methylocystis sp. H4A]
MVLTKTQHLSSSNMPKRILSLDGGGIRGILTLEFLSLIESKLKTRFNRPDFVLSDYFDLIGGTSTGSIIAAGLACGMSVEELKDLYREIGSQVFKQGFLRNGIWAPKFPADRLQQALDEKLGADTTLQSDKIRTGLMIMTKRLDTGSPWPLHNCPDAPYAKQDGQLRLTQVVRASTAAPTYFEPESIAISSRDGSSVNGAFVDGGVSPFNDPALQLLMVAALAGHGFKWPRGKDKLLLVSVGTGTFKETHQADALVGMLTAKQGLIALQSLMDDCGRMNQAILQWLTHCLTPWTIDRAMGDMKLDSEGGPQLATYARYNVLLEKNWLKRELGVQFDASALSQIAQMDNPNNMDQLADLGKRAAVKQISAEHFDIVFDL